MYIPNIFNVVEKKLYAFTDLLQISSALVCSQPDTSEILFLCKRQLKMEFFASHFTYFSYPKKYHVYAIPQMVLINEVNEKKNLKNILFPTDSLQIQNNFNLQWFYVFIVSKLF